MDRLIHVFVCLFVCLVGWLIGWLIGFCIDCVVYVGILCVFFLPLLTIYLYLSSVPLIYTSYTSDLTLSIYLYQSIHLSIYLQVDATPSRSLPEDETDLDAYLSHSHDLIILSSIDESRRAAELESYTSHIR